LADDAGTRQRAAQWQRDISDPERRRLVLRIEPSGAKLWLFRYKFDGKPHRLALGTYPGMTLAMARAEAQAHRDLLDRGVDPKPHALRAALPRSPTLQSRATSTASSSWLTSFLSATSNRIDGGPSTSSASLGVMCYPHGRDATLAPSRPGRSLNSSMALWLGARA